MLQVPVSLLAGLFHSLTPSMFNASVCVGLWLSLEVPQTQTRKQQGHFKSFLR